MAKNLNRRIVAIHDPLAQLDAPGAPEFAPPAAVAVSRPGPALPTGTRYKVLVDFDRVTETQLKAAAHARHISVREYLRLAVANQLCTDSP